MEEDPAQVNGRIREKFVKQTWKLNCTCILQKVSNPHQWDTPIPQVCDWDCTRLPGFSPLHFWYLLIEDIWQTGIARAASSTSSVQQNSLPWWKCPVSALSSRVTCGYWAFDTWLVWLENRIFSFTWLGAKMLDHEAWDGRKGRKSISS